MTSGADLFVVCKQCGSEVSPYITECPYCGSRLRRRAPKLPRARAPGRPARGRAGALSLLRRRRSSARALPRARPRHGGGRFSATRPYMTAALVGASCVAWIVYHAEPAGYLQMAVFGPLHGDWWKLFTSEFAYLHGFYAFLVLVPLGIFGWLLERRHGPLLVLALFLAAGAGGALATTAAYSTPWVAGANGGALALLAAWAAPDIRAAREGSYYEGDLLGAGAIAALLLSVPFVIEPREASWLVGVVGAALGLLVGLGLSMLDEESS